MEVVRLFVRRMRKSLPLMCLGLLLPLSSGVLSAQSDDATKAPAKEQAPVKPAPEVPPVITHHELHSGGQTLHYTATVGLMPLQNEKGEVEAHIFYVAYTLDLPEAERAKRSLMFSFNGGPGSASIW